MKHKAKAAGEKTYLYNHNIASCNVLYVLWTGHFLNDLCILKATSCSETQITLAIFYSADLRAVPLEYRKPLNTFGHTNHFGRIHHIQRVSGLYLKLTYTSSVQQAHLSRYTFHSPLKATLKFRQPFCVVAAWIARQSKLYVFTQMNNDPESKFPQCETIMQAYVSGGVTEPFWLKK